MRQQSHGVDVSIDFAVWSQAIGDTAAACSDQFVEVER